MHFEEVGQGENKSQLDCLFALQLALDGRLVFTRCVLVHKVKLVHGVDLLGPTDVILIDLEEDLTDAL